MSFHSPVSVVTKSTELLFENIAYLSAYFSQ